jgi:hypothetical protein
MAAIVPTKVATIDARVDNSYGTNVSPRIVYVDVTTTATSNTIDLDDYVDGGINGILGVVMQTLDGAVNATAPTWSGTTITTAGYAGSGGEKLAFLVY